MVYTITSVSYFSWSHNTTLKILLFSMEFHQEQLKKCCRVCGKRLLKAKGTKGKSHVFKCCQNSAQLQKAFDINVQTDEALVHPEYFCLSCRSIAKRKIQASADGVAYRGKDIGQYVMKWQPHQDGCDVS